MEAFRQLDSDALLLIIYVLLALGLSFLCSVAEAVLLSITPAYIENQKAQGTRLAPRLQRLRQDNVDRSLAAILTLNTIAHTAGAIGAGAKATLVFGSAWFGVFSAVMTLLILFLSEIVPKTIGTLYWPKLVWFTVWFVNALIVGLYPIVWMAEGLTRFIGRGKVAHVFSRDEFVAMTRIGEESGGIHPSEVRIIRNLFRFGALKAKNIMTPRTVIGALVETLTVAEAATVCERVRFSRLPIHRTGLDSVTGYVLRDEIFLGQAKGRGAEPIGNLRHELLAVPEQTTLTSLLEQFLESRQHIALVVDEYGGTAGLVSLEDVVETLMGTEIMDETDEIEDMQGLARKQGRDRANHAQIEVGRTGPRPGIVGSRPPDNPAFRRPPKPLT